MATRYETDLAGRLLALKANTEIFGSPEDFLKAVPKHFTLMEIEKLKSMNGYLPSDYNPDDYRD